MVSEDDRRQVRTGVRVSVVTVSSTTSAEADDPSSKAISETLEAHGHKVVRKNVVRGGQLEIQRVLRELIEDGGVEAVVMSGGTGLSKQDVTLEAVAPFQEKPMPGFGELFRMLSYDEVGSVAVHERAAAFASEGKVVFCLPGSERAVRLATDRIIAPELGRLVDEATR